ncbi:ABC transporter permease [Longispora urticae]
MNLTICALTLRALFGRRRFLLLLPAPLILMGLTWLAVSLGASDQDLVTAVVVGLGMTAVVPLMSLIIGASVLGSEIDDGTVIHILTKPIPRWRIILSKLVVASGVSALVTAVPMFVVGAVIDGPRLGAGLAGGAAIGATVYSALFLALSVVSRRPVLLGLVYVLVWEGLLTNLVSGAKVLSVQKYVATFAQSLSGTPLMERPLSVAVAVAMSVVLAVLATYYASVRLRSFSVAGETS